MNFRKDVLGASQKVEARQQKLFQDFSFSVAPTHDDIIILQDKAKAICLTQVNVAGVTPKGHDQMNPKLILP